MARTRTYFVLSHFKTFEERFEYLKLEGQVGAVTFGFDRWLNQRFYTSREWKTVRNYVITRDYGCDLGIRDREISRGLVVHHMNPIKREDIVEGEPSIFDPEFLICTSLLTHNAIHYGDASLLPRGPIERISGDTKLW